MILYAFVQILSYSTDYLQAVSHKPAKLILSSTYRLTHLKLKCSCKPAFKQNPYYVVR